MPDVFAVYMFDEDDVEVPFELLPCQYHVTPEGVELV
jgi:hypothetical protein